MNTPSDNVALNVAPTSRAWTGLGHWNLYFIAKLLLYFGGYLNLDLYYNLLFAAVLLVPLGRGWTNRVRHIAAVPVGIALLYHDSWFPPFERLLAQPEILHFSMGYLLELLGRFINWELVGAGFIVFVSYLFLSQWLRLTTFNILFLTGIALSQWVTLPAWLHQHGLSVQAQGVAPTPSLARIAGQPVPTDVTAAAPASPQGKPDGAALNKALGTFYEREADRRVTFPSVGASAPFDILFISICSLSWSDLDEAGLLQHPLFKNMNVIFDDFNGATSYSGPAVLRLLRANCGQAPHAGLYQPTDEACYLFQNLDRLGFKTEAALNHDGAFQGFLNELKTEGKLPEPYIPTDMRSRLTGFDGSPIWGDYQTLEHWWTRRIQSDAQRTALLYNTITLHDGNREATADGGGRSAPFQTRAQTLLDELNAFVSTLEKSGRRVMLVIIPEHGAALKGDKMQISGMREVPTRSITHVPVAVRLIGVDDAKVPDPIRVQGPSSFLALSELVARVLAGKVFEQAHIDWTELTADLPTTPTVSENEGSAFMKYGDTPYVRMGGSNWIEYPQ